MRLLPALAFGTLMLPLAAYAADPNSYAQPDQVRVTHLDLDLKIDFPQRQLDGQATLKLDWKNPKAQSLVLDTRDLKIAKIEALGADGKATALKYALAPRDKQLGSKLTIATPTHPAQVRIVYTTSPEASGLQWLTPAQTADKKLPFMFSQSESIHARSWVPLQDSPAIRFTYDAHVSAPKDVRVVMSAINDAKHPLDGDFTFDQPHPIPSYLLAIGAGDIAVKETGPRSAVYAEPSIVDKAAHEFEDTEKLIATTEQLYGPYAWGRYDILVLPPSFPYGGMENPNMTFATPTVLVGDKSLVSLVSHELAHSWSGNLVTRAHGATSGSTKVSRPTCRAASPRRCTARRWPTRKPCCRPARCRRASARCRPIRRSWRPIRVAWAPTIRCPTWPTTRARGSCARWSSASAARMFDDYLKGYFNHFAWHSITTEQMLDYMKPNLIEKYPGRMSWDEVKAWVYGEGIPKDAPLPDSPRFNTIDRERTRFPRRHAGRRQARCERLEHAGVDVLPRPPARRPAAGQAAAARRRLAPHRYAERGDRHALVQPRDRRRRQGRVASRRRTHDADRPAVSDRAAVQGIRENAGRPGLCRTGLRQGEGRLSPADPAGGGGHHRQGEESEEISLAALPASGSATTSASRTEKNPSCRHRPIPTTPLWKRMLFRRLKFLAWLVALLVIVLGGSYLFAPQWLMQANFKREAMAAHLDTHSVQAGDTRWVYFEGGDGPTIVLLHGFAADRNVWLPVAKLLTPHFHLIIPDLPGWGESSRVPDASYNIDAQAARLDAFVQTLRLQRFVLVGHSIGGAIAGVYASEHPEHVAELALVDCVRSEKLAERVRPRGAGRQESVRVSTTAPGLPAPPRWRSTSRWIFPAVSSTCWSSAIGRTTPSSSAASRSCASPRNISPCRTGSAS